jgi:threonine dehydrogenase-like Zn-dependent dehydrogenase
VGADVDDDWLGALATVNPVVSCGSCAACLACEEQQCEQAWVLGVRPDVDGAFAERITVPGRNVVRLPESMTPEHGALVEPLAVGYHALVRAAPRPDDTVLVIGGGPIGQAAALAARRVGVRRVLVSEPNPARASILQRLGVRVVDPGSLDAAVRPELGDQPSIVIDAVGSADTLQTALTLSRRGARIVLVGMASPQLGFAAYHLSAAERTVIGTFCYSADDFRETAAWVARHPEVGAALTGAVISLDEAPEVFGRLAAGELLANKILVSPGRR